MTAYKEALVQHERESVDAADYYETHDTSDEMDTGEWETPEPLPEGFVPMSVQSVRMPTALLNAVRNRADAEHRTTSEMIRKLLESGVAARQLDRPSIQEQLDELRGTVEELRSNSLTQQLAAIRAFLQPAPRGTVLDALLGSPSAPTFAFAGLHFPDKYPEWNPPLPGRVAVPGTRTTARTTTTVSETAMPKRKSSAA